MPRPKAEITNLEGIVSSLPREDRELVGRIFEVVVSTGRLEPPDSMAAWLKKLFGSVDRAVSQQIVRVTNLITLEESLFNQLRSRRPAGAVPGRSRRELKEDVFRDPLVTTPRDTFGRIEGKYCITASNVAKYEGLHGVVVFNEPDPLRFTREQVIDYVETGWRWAQKAHASDPEASYFFLVWNCGERAGASLPHGHAQVVLGRRRHYAKVERLRRAALAYSERYGSSYYDDLYRVHRLLGCGFEKDGVKVLASLTPVKEKETILMAQELSLSLEERAYEVLACFRDRMGVTSFNLGLYPPPVGHVDEDWEDFPVMVRLVDRGEPESASSDIGAMELFASSVISSDPFEVARTLREGLAGYEGSPVRSPESKGSADE